MLRMKVVLLVFFVSHYCLAESEDWVWPEGPDTDVDLNEKFPAEKRLEGMTWEEHDIQEATAKCEVCIAVSYIFHSNFETAHKSMPSSMTKLPYVDIIDITGKTIVSLLSSWETSLVIDELPK